MKLDTLKRNVETSGVQESAQFTIEVNPVAIDILSSKIYTNNYQAIVRELACNAWDAHVAAGNTTTPFDVHFPNYLNKEFKIRDYGTGLEHAAVMQLYSTYFASDKRDTNALIGGLGLGSKSPFAYTNAFSVRSYVNGEVRTYAVYRDAEGIPRTDLVDVSTTSEPNGLEISVPVQEGDSYKFEDEVGVLRYFPLRPNIKGADLKELNYKFRGKYAALDENGTSPVVVMGNVAYRIARGQLEKLGFGREVFGFIASDKIVYFAQIGTLSISASREELNYDDKTVAELRMVIKRGLDELTDSVKIAAAAETRAMKRHYDLFEFPRGMRSVVAFPEFIEFGSTLSVRKIARESWHRSTLMTETLHDRYNFDGNSHPAILVIDGPKNTPFKKIITENPEFHPKDKGSYYRMSNRDALILQGDDLEIKKFVGQADPQYVFYSSNYHTPTNPAAGMPRGAGTRRKPEEIERQLWTTHRLVQYHRSWDWNKTKMKIVDLDPQHHILVGVANLVPMNHETGVQLHPNFLDAANWFLKDKIFVGIPRGAWKLTRKKSKCLDIYALVTAGMAEFKKELTEEQYVNAMYQTQFREAYVALTTALSNKKTWEDYAPESLMHHICQTYNYTVRSSLVDKIRDIEAYLGKRLFNIDAADPFTDHQKKLYAGAEEWLLWSYPEFFEYAKNGRWSQVNQMTAHYINLKEGISQ